MLVNFSFLEFYCFTFYNFLQKLHVLYFNVEANGYKGWFTCKFKQWFVFGRKEWTPVYHFFSNKKLKLKKAHKTRNQKEKNDRKKACFNSSCHLDLETESRTSAPYLPMSVSRNLFLCLAMFSSCSTANFNCKIVTFSLMKAVLIEYPQTRSILFRTYRELAQTRLR